MKRIRDLLVLCGLMMTLFGCATPPLITAARDNDIANLQSLIQKGGDVNAKNGGSGKTALMEAAKQGHIESVKALLKAGADVNLRDDYDDTALTWATGKCHTAIVQVLIDKSADVNAQNKGYGSTSLMMAAECNDVVSIKALLGKGANLNVKNHLGMTALGAATFKGRTETVKILLDAGATANEVWTKGETGPLYYAAMKGNDPIVKLLIAKGADVNIRPDRTGGWTPLMIAAAEGHPTTVSILIKAGANANATNKFGRTALMFASGYGYTDIAKQLLDHGAQIDAVPSDGEGVGALIAATRKGHKEIVSMLVNRGANINITDSKGKTALAYATDGRYEEIAMILRKAGANK